MRLIPTGSPLKVAIIAATRRELATLRSRKHLTQFADNITTPAHKNEQYNCFLMVYEFETHAQSKLFKLAYGLANRRFKHVRRVRPSHKKPPSYYAARKAATRKRILHRQRKRTKTRYFKLIPILKSGRIADLEVKAREIARNALVADLFS